VFPKAAYETATADATVTDGWTLTNLSFISTLTFASEIQNFFSILTLLDFLGDSNTMKTLHANNTKLVPESWNNESV
jgi:hypothetical protein